MSTMRPMVCVASTMPPATGTAPPVRPVPPARGVTGTPCFSAIASVAATSAVSAASTTASGMPADGLALVDGMGVAPGLGRVHLRRPEATLELRQGAFDGISRRQTDLGRSDQHPCFIALSVALSTRGPCGPLSPLR